MMPKPGDAHRKLEKLVGDWTGDETIAPSPFDPVGGTAIGRIRNRLALDGFAVIQDYEQERNGAIGFRGHGVFRWDEASEGYELHWFDSFGAPLSIFRGNFEGDVLTLIWAGPNGSYRAVFDLSGENRYQYQMDVAPDGADWFTFTVATYTKTG
jgi:hypothetical protein